MPSNPKYRVRSRTIAMPEVRARMIAAAAAYLDVSGETFIQSSISAALATLAENNETFGLILLRIAGVDWDDLTKLRRDEVIGRIMGAR